MSKLLTARWISPLIIFAIGAAVFAGLYVTRPDPGSTETVARPRLVRAFCAEPTSHRIAIKAYGTSQAAEEWSAIAEVVGNITWIHERFQVGEVVPGGEVIATIDKLDFEIAVKTAETDVASQQQQLLELDQSEANLQSMVELREQQLAFARSELDRIKSLLARNAGSKADYDRISSAYVERLAAVRDLRNRQALIPTKRKSLEIATESATLRLKQARRDVARCDVRLPYSALCLSRNVDPHQHVSAGQNMGMFLALEKAEVLAFVEPRRALTLLPAWGESLGSMDLRTQTRSLIEEMRDNIEALSVPVDVTWHAGDSQAQWRGRLARASASIDEATRSLPLFIEVDDAFSQVQIGVKPALVPGMFLELTLYGGLLDDVYVVPREAIRDGAAYVVRDGRLEIIPVDVLAFEENVAVVDSGLSDGDRVVLSDLFPAANGMQLRVEEVANPITPRRDLPTLESP